ncbi:MULTISPECIES: leucine-rich repeat protein [unclassified Ruminococcus]|uniref:leucine-rich repeat protein n=1 Tax=unclassified Ruminococcus TaxID=2608920 RepID=UPI00210DC03F|nr:MULTISPECIES: leucine-rich repeat protein [unclassified Ruminococcus]MCQ4022117.1 leucine-rich repeat protein [Ruminococcus sp. zg-924]MCQ4114437.1 leucine-rich repeat protein [Ruminococcus sp. zg-921]
MQQNNICYNCFNEKGNNQICPHCGYNQQQDREKYPMALPVGTVLGGKYILGRVLGQGGFGITYKAQDYQTKEIVAIKEFFPDTMATRSNSTAVTAFTQQRDQSFLYGKKCFLDEAKTLAEFIGNPNIVRVYSYFEENNTAYFVMEYVDGISLKTYLENNGGKITLENAEKLLFPIMDALSAVHSKSIIHRDISPENISITKDGVVKLLDFGAARYSFGNESQSLDVILKHGYAPKEQYTRRGKQGPFTDVYSFAATFYKAITGRIPPDSIDRIDDDELIMPSALGCKIPKNTEDVLIKALSVQTADRYQSMGEFKAALLASQQEENTFQTDFSSTTATNVINFGQTQTVQQNTSNFSQNPNYSQQNTNNFSQNLNYSQQLNTAGGYGNAQNTFTNQQSSFVVKKNKPKWLVPVISCAASLAVIAIVVIIIVAVSGSNKSAVVPENLENSAQSSVVGDENLENSAQSSVVDEEDLKNFEYTIESDGVTIDEYLGDDSEVTIPAIIEGKPVTAIGESAFNFNSDVVNVTIPDGVVVIGKDAFRSCSNLESIIIPDSVTEIGGSSFWGTALKSVTIPKGVSEIKKWTFIECKDLESVTISEGVTTIGDSAFKECRSLKDISFPSSVTEIGQFAFADCSGLTSLTIPETITDIGDQAFGNCNNLKSVTFSDGVTTIFDSVFFSCDNLESVTIPDSVTLIDSSAFLDCDSLKKVSIPSDCEVASAAFNSEVEITRRK